jgi:DNA-binding NarL/FixJ family response regulator
MLHVGARSADGYGEEDAVGDRTDITVVLAVRGDRRTELSAALTAATLVVAEEPDLDVALGVSAELVPDVVLLDELADRAATGRCCLDATLRTPASRLVVLVAADDEVAYETLLQGAFSTVPAGATAGEVVAVVRSTARGESTIVAGSARRLLDDAQRVARAASDPFVPTLRLTETEQEVLRLRAEGLTPADIAACHDVTARLVNLHMGYAVAKVHHHLHRVRARDAVSTTSHPAPR